jgi:hypothetical protein
MGWTVLRSTPTRMNIEPRLTVLTVGATAGYFGFDPSSSPDDLASRSTLAQPITTPIRQLKLARFDGKH